MGRGISVQRIEANAAALRSLIDAGSPCIVRNNLDASSILERRRNAPRIGDRCGKLVVTGYVKSPKGGLSAVIVSCDCGFPEYTVAASSIKGRTPRRCNLCALKSSANTRKLYWGYSEIMPEDDHRERLLNRLSAAISRCHKQTDKNYPNYGGRGVYVCDEWRSDRAAFLRYVRTLPGWDTPKYEMDRIDVNGGYDYGNIRFVSRSENMLNKRRIQDLEREIADLKARLRHSELRADEPIHNSV